MNNSDLAKVYTQRLFKMIQDDNGKNSSNCFKKYLFDKLSLLYLKVKLILNDVNLEYCFEEKILKDNWAIKTIGKPIELYDNFDNISASKIENNSASVFSNHINCIP